MTNPKAPYGRFRVPQITPQTSARSGPLRVVALVHRYPPEHNAGAEWMLHEMLADLARRGWCCRVLADCEPGFLDGVEIVPRGPRNAELFGWADVAVTHLDRTRQAVELASRAGTPLVHIVHNDRQLTFHRVARGQATAVVFNSRWIEAACPWRGPSVVVRPPVDAGRYAEAADGPHDRVSLVNLTEPKGALVFYDVARRLRRVPFLGVRGAYGYQEPAPDLPNLEVIDQTPRIGRDVYARTRVLMVPSSYESWGRVAVEAMSCGIPVVAHPTPGLREALGTAGVFVDRADVTGWAREVRRLARDRSAHRDAADAARARAVALARQADLDLAVWRSVLADAAGAG